MSWERQLREYERMKYGGEIKIDYILIPSRSVEELKKTSTPVGCDQL